MNKKIKLNTLEKVIVGIFFACGMFFVIGNFVIASERHHHSQPVAPSNTSVNIYSTKGVALGIAAAQHHFSSSTPDIQVSAAIGSYDSSSAVSFAFAKKFKQSLISGSVSSEGGIMGFGGSIGLKF